jgi:hypothetical protein
VNSMNGIDMLTIGCTNLEDLVLGVGMVVESRWLAIVESRWEVKVDEVVWEVVERECGLED